MSSPEVTYKWTAPRAGIFFFHTLGSTTDTVLYVLDGACGRELKCDDDAIGFLDSYLGVELAQNDEVTVVVDTHPDSTPGPFQLSVEEWDGACDSPLVNLLECSFEGGFADWTTTDVTGAYVPLQASAAGTTDPLMQFFPSSPTDGTWSLLHGFAGTSPGTIEISQNVFVPAGASAVTFDYRAAWDITTGTPTQDRRFDIVVEPAAGGAALGTFNVLVAPANGSADTGLRRTSVPLGSTGGALRRLRFVWTVPEGATGPGFFDLDNVLVY